MPLSILIIDELNIGGGAIPKGSNNYSVVIGNKKLWNMHLTWSPGRFNRLEKRNLSLYWYLTILHEMGHLYYEHEDIETSGGLYELRECEADSFVYQCIKKEYWYIIDKYILEYFGNNSFAKARIKVSKTIAEQQEVIIAPYEEQKVA